MSPPLHVAALRAGRRAMAVVVLVGLTLTVVAAWQIGERDRGQASRRLETEAGRVASSIEAELRRHIEVAQAAAVVLESEGPVDQATWTALAERLDIDEDFPALFAFNQTLLATPRDLADLERQFGIELRPPDPSALRQRYGVIATIHPVSGNQPALGYDVFTTPAAEAALEASVAVGDARLSDALRIVQETEDRFSVVAYEPFFDADGRMAGWVNAVLRGQDFLDGVVSLPPHVGVIVRDETADGALELGRLGWGPEQTPDASVLAPVTLQVEALGQTWEVVSYALPGFRSTSERQAPWTTLLVGALLTLSTAVILRSAGLREARASVLAEERTVELTSANARLLASNDALERASRAKDDFLAVVSHEFRTPLTVIQGFASTLLEYRRQALDEHTIDILERISTNAGRLDDLVDDLLLAAKLDSDTVDPHPGPVDVAAAVQRAVADLPSSTEVSVEVDDGCRAHVDPQHLHRILENLLTNAQKYGSPPIRVRGRASGSTVVLDVRDDGPGIAPALAARLFERFAQGQTGNARSTKGVGLGLSIVRDLCRANGGDVDLLPSDAGAHFRVTLPACTTEPASAAPEPAAADEVDARV